MIKVFELFGTKITCKNYFDYYVPVSTEISDENSFPIKSYQKEEVFYCEISDNKQPVSLLEFKIGEKTNRLLEVVLTAVVDVNYYNAPVVFSEIIYGWPLINCDINHQEIKDEYIVEKITAFLTTYKLEVVIDDITKPLKKVVLDVNFEIGLDEKTQIRYLCFNNIEFVNYTLLKEIFFQGKKKL